jgi:hypothetical protein
VELNELRLQIERLTHKVGYLEDATKGSISTREERAGNTALIKANIKELFLRVSNLETADKELGKRFFQVWVGVGIALFGVLLESTRR